MYFNKPTSKSTDFQIIRDNSLIPRQDDSKTYTGKEKASPLDLYDNSSDVANRCNQNYQGTEDPH